jgi:transposase-like protein
MASMQIMTGRERRRSWSEAQKRAIVAAAFAPGAIVADVARRAEICAGQIYRWRQEIRHADRGFAESLAPLKPKRTSSEMGLTHQKPSAALARSRVGRRTS